MPWQGFRNVSTPERVVRIVLGIGLFALGWSGAVGGVAGIALRVFGLVPLITGIVGWCPVYALCGIDTRRGNKPARPS